MLWNCVSLRFKEIHFGIIVGQSITKISKTCIAYAPVKINKTKYIRNRKVDAKGC